ncbi:ammecr1 protein [Zopfochytrium polystomum]|nr:ammecr1 protein [Zopfochytrium polystomum]
MEEHCYFCFDVLHAALLKDSSSAPHAPVPSALYGLDDADSYPLFVTWNISTATATAKRTSRGDGGKGGKALRGCIGNFSPMKLRSGLEEYAKISAFNDRRFDPISVDELPLLSCAVSLLVDFEKGKDYLDWEVGVHGIWIEFRDRNGSKRTATYLPEVSLEQGWTKEEAIDSLLRKGGFSGKITAQVREAIILTRYQSKKASVSYEEYIAWRAKLVN